MQTLCESLEATEQATGDSSDNMHITSGANHAARVHINHARVSCKLVYQLN